MGRRKPTPPPPPPAVTKAEARQTKEEAKVDKQLAAREAARTRAKTGRRSLISGTKDERGIYSNTLG